jgi:hypothetical protein
VPANQPFCLRRRVGRDLRGQQTGSCSATHTVSLLRKSLQLALVRWRLEQQHAVGPAALPMQATNDLRSAVAEGWRDDGRDGPLGARS